MSCKTALGQIVVASLQGTYFARHGIGAVGFCANLYQSLLTGGTSRIKIHLEARAGTDVVNRCSAPLPPPGKHCLRQLRAACGSSAQTEPDRGAESNACRLSSTALRSLLAQSLAAKPWQHRPGRSRYCTVRVR